MTKNLVIRTIVLKNNNIDCIGASAFNDPLIHSKNLESIDLSENSISDIGVKALT